MRTFLKPFLVVLLALTVASTLTRLDGSLSPSPAHACVQRGSLERPILVLTDAQVICERAKSGHFHGTGLYVRGDTPRWIATDIGLGLPLLLIATAFVMAVRRLRGRARIVAGTVLAGIGGYFFAMTSLARYAEAKLLHGEWHQLTLWVNDPYALRDSVIWLGSGLAAVAGLWLLTMAAVHWHRQATA